MRYKQIPYNKMAFLPEEQRQCADFIKFLMNSNSGEYFNEFCVSSDGYCTIIYWIRKPINKEYVSGSFEFVDENEEIYTEDEINDIVNARAEYMLKNQESLDKITKQ